MPEKKKRQDQRRRHKPRLPDPQAPAVIPHPQRKISIILTHAEWEKLERVREALRAGSLGVYPSVSQTVRYAIQCVWVQLENVSQGVKP